MTDFKTLYLEDGKTLNAEAVAFSSTIQTLVYDAVKDTGIKNKLLAAIREMEPYEPSEVAEVSMSSVKYLFIQLLTNPNLYC